MEEESIVINIPIAIEKYSTNPINVYPQPANSHVVFEATDTSVTSIRVVAEREINNVVWDSGVVSGRLVVFTPSLDFRPGIYRYRATCYKAGYSNTYTGYFTWNRPIEKEAYSGTPGDNYRFLTWAWFINSGQVNFERNEIRYIIRAIHQGGTTYGLVDTTYSSSLSPGVEVRVWSPGFYIPSNAPQGLYDAEVIISNNNTGVEYVRARVRNAWRVGTHLGLITYAATGVPKGTVLYRGRDYFQAAMEFKNIGTGAIRVGGVATAESSGYVNEIFRFSGIYLEPGEVRRIPNEGFIRVLVPSNFPTGYANACFYIWEEKFNRSLDTVIMTDAWRIS